MGLFSTLIYYLAILVGVIVFFKLSPKISLLNRTLMALGVFVVAFLIFWLLSIVLALIIVIILIAFLLSFLNKGRFNFKKFKL